MDRDRARDVEIPATALTDTDRGRILVDLLLLADALPSHHDDKIGAPPFREILGRGA